MKARNFGFSLSKSSKRTLLSLLIIFLVWRAFVFGMMYYSNVKLHEGGMDKIPFDISMSMRQMIHWDAKSYLVIINQGYQPNSALPVFYPLLPALVKMLSLSHIPPIVGGGTD